MAELRLKLEKLLNHLNIKYEVIEHPEVFTVEAMMPHLKDCKGIKCKNLFVKEKKKKKLWLVTTGYEKNFTLTDLGKKMGISGGFRFADENILEEKLGVKQGCVTPLALMQDTSNDVSVIFDSDFRTLSADDGLIYSHPMVNSASMGLSSQDLLRFVSHTGHNPVFIDFNSL